MKLQGTISVAFLLLVFQSSVFSRPDGKLEPLFRQLDSVLEESGRYEAEKEAGIAALRARRHPHLKPEECLWFNKMMYDEYVVYKADSAMVYAEANIAVAKQLHRQDLVDRWTLDKVFLLAAQGLMNEAEKELQAVDEQRLDEKLRFQYYYTKVYLYSHLAQFSGEASGVTARYHDIETSLRQEAVRHIDPGHPLYCSFAAFLYMDHPRPMEGRIIRSRLQKAVDSCSLSTLTDALNAYSLAVMYQREGDEENYMKYLICSAIADVRLCNRDIASLEELSNLIYGFGDIDRGYAYISHCLKAALQYPNRVRMVNISAVMDRFRQAYSERNRIQEERLRKSFHTTSILSAVLALAVLLICIQFAKLSRSRKKLSTANAELSAMNETLETNNSRLFESNYVKERYIGYVFSICSSYITKLEEYRKNIMRNLIVGRTEEIRKTVSDTSMANNELKDFYKSFDAVFLQIYPDFVDDFNSLLKPGERIVLKKGELLNTELRIYALVRLGINDSVKIAEFLHCSPQTVYNNRLKTRNKAAVSKDDFDRKVQTLGKIQE